MEIVLEGFPYKSEKNVYAISYSFFPVLVQKAENLRRNGRGLKELGRPRPGRLDLKGERVECQTGKAHFLAEKLEGSGCAVATIAHHGMAGKPGVASNLMLAAGQKVAFDKSVMGASAENPEAGLAWGLPARAFGMDAAPGLL